MSIFSCTADKIRNSDMIPRAHVADLYMQTIADCGHSSSKLFAACNFLWYINGEVRQLCLSMGPGGVGGMMMMMKR